MLVELDGRPRDLETLHDGKVAQPVGDDDVASLGEGRDDRGDARERLGVDDGRRLTKEGGEVALQLLVDV